MKILHVITGLQKAAGTSVFCVDLCDGLSRIGVETAIAVQHGDSDAYSPQENVPVFALSRGFEDLNFKPDLVHIHALWDPFLHRFAAWARKNQIPLVFSPHGMLTPWALKQKRLKKGLALALYQYRDLQSAALLHATASSEVEDIRRLRLKQPVAVAPLGVNVPAEAPPVRHNTPRIALFVSRVHPKKGLLNLVEAWAQVRSSKVRECESALVERPGTGDQRTEAGKNASALSLQPSTFLPWQLVIAGPDQDGHTAEIKAKAKKLGLSVDDIPSNQLISQPANLPCPPDIVFTGPVYGADKDALYRMADLLVLPTYSENFGVVVIEALAQGCPVITTKGTPWQELLGQEGSNALRAGSKIPSGSGHVQGSSQVGTNSSFILHPSSLADNGRCGWWIDIGVEPLAAALREAINLSDEERHAMGENGRRLVEAKYTWPAIAEQMKAAYAWILNGGELPPSVMLE
jgi:glycosyltransferase involved in cell wall biosynthesis